jgi:hypothetical protein
MLRLDIESADALVAVSFQMPDQTGVTRARLNEPRPSLKVGQERQNGSHRGRVIVALDALEI